MQKAKQFIDDGDFEKAKRILITVDHPLADKWLERIGVASTKKTSQLWKWLSVSILALLACSICYFSLVFFISTEVRNLEFNNVRIEFDSTATSISATNSIRQTEIS